MKELIDRIKEIDAEKAELEAALVSARAKTRDSIVQQIRGLVLGNGFDFDEILPLVVPPTPAKTDARIFSTWAMRDDPSVTYTRGVLPAKLKAAMVSVGLDPRMGEDRAKFKAEHMVQV